jgi:acyl carrier protein
VSDREQAVAREIVRLARVHLAQGEEPLAAGEPLAAHLDSVMLLTLVVAVEDRFRVKLTDDDAAAASTLEDLARLVVARADPSRLPAVEPGP